MVFLRQRLFHILIEILVQNSRRIIIQTLDLALHGIQIFVIRFHAVRPYNFFGFFIVRNLIRDKASVRKDNQRRSIRQDIVSGIQSCIIIKSEQIKQSGQNVQRACRLCHFHGFHFAVPEDKIVVVNIQCTI